KIYRRSAVLLPAVARRSHEKKTPSIARRGRMSQNFVMSALSLRHPPALVHVAAVVVVVGIVFGVTDLGRQGADVVVEHQHHLAAVVVDELLGLGIHRLALGLVGFGAG